MALSDIDIQYEKERGIKALKTIRIITEAVGHRPLSELRVLEIGCFTGEVSLRLAPYFDEYVAIDLDPELIQLAIDKPPSGKQPVFSVMNAEQLNFSAASFDIVICSHVYEHVERPELMMREIQRVLRQQGVCFFAAGNRLCLIEPHHRLPFLSWFPRSVANRYLRYFRGEAAYTEKLLYLSQLRHLVKDFTVEDFTLAVVQYPEKFMATDMVRSGTWKHKFVSTLLPLLYRLSPTYLWVLKKPVKSVP